MSAGDDIPLDVALIAAYRMGLEQGLNAGLSAAAAACLDAAERILFPPDFEPVSFEKAAEDLSAITADVFLDDAFKVAADTIAGPDIHAIDDRVRDQIASREQREAQAHDAERDGVFDFFFNARDLATSRGFRRLSVRRIVRRGDDEVCYEVDGDVNLSPGT